MTTSNKKKATSNKIRVKIDRRVFNPIYRPYLNSQVRTQLFYGGSSSGKSVFLAQRCMIDLLNGGRNYLITRAVGRTLRKSVFAELRQVAVDWGLAGLFKFNKTDLTVTCNNGYQAILWGMNDIENLKSVRPEKGVITDIWVEEATETKERDVTQLRKRLRGGDRRIKKRITLSFNPILRSNWIYKKYFKAVKWADDQRKYIGKKLSILKTWYIHNNFLNEDDVEELEDEADPYFKEVYTYGNWGVLGNLIFKNWKIQDLSEMTKQWINRRNGLDFGFSNDPAACVATHYDRKKKTIYIYDELYEKQLTNPELAKKLKKIIGGDYVKCDSAEPKSIKELQINGIAALSAEKGKDSVKHGIQWLRQQKIIVHTECIETANEFRSYKWKEDRSGEALTVPVDKFNHAMDALRYAYEDEYKKAGRLVLW